MEPIINNTEVIGKISIAKPSSVKTHYGVEVFKEVSKYKLDSNGAYVLQDDQPVLQSINTDGYEVVSDEDTSVLLKRNAKLRVKRLIVPAVRLEAFNLLAGVFQYVFSVGEKQRESFIAQNLTTMSSLLGRLIAITSDQELKDGEYLSLTGAISFLTDFVEVEKTLVKELELFLVQSQKAK